MKNCHENKNISHGQTRTTTDEKERKEEDSAILILKLWNNSNY
jgi:hypothetical protein